MTTEVTRGEGTLYDVRTGDVVTGISYRVHEEQMDLGSRKTWWGEMTAIQAIRIPDGDRYVIELEDKRKGRCTVSRRINKAVILVPARYFYAIQGSGPLE